MTTASPQYVRNAQGRPIAVVLLMEDIETALGRLLEDLPDETREKIYRQVLQKRALNALQAIGDYAKEHGLDQITDEEIEAEIQAVRSQHSSGHNK